MIDFSKIVFLSFDSNHLNIQIYRLESFMNSVICLYNISPAFQNSQICGLSLNERKYITVITKMFLCKYIIYHEKKMFNTFNNLVLRKFEGKWMEKKIERKIKKKMKGNRNK